jgi:amino acid transporter
MISGAFTALACTMTALRFFAVQGRERYLPIYLSNCQADTHSTYTPVGSLHGAVFFGLIA